MKPDPIERVFGRSRLRMVTGDHVEVFREAIGPGERRRYTKRFLETGDADFRQWTEREWRILARLIGHGIRCVPDVVQFDGGAHGGMRQVQTYDAGVTVDQWATLLPVAREGARRRHVFEDCAHWWALAHHCLAALDEIHALQLVHLDIKADNICIPYGPADFDPEAEEASIHASFERLALIDFAFSLVSREKLATALPIGWQKDYDYQSPRLLRALEAGRAGDLRPTQELDWRCDLYSLAAMLRRYLPDDGWARGEGMQAGWSARRYEDARALVYRLRECHDRDFTQWRPHPELIETTGARLAEPDLAASLQRGWTLVRDADASVAPALATPMTRIAARRRADADAAVSAADFAAPVTVIETPIAPPAVTRNPRTSMYVSPLAPPAALARSRASHAPRRGVYAALLAAVAALAAPSFVGDPAHPLDAAAREVMADVLARFAAGGDRTADARPPASVAEASPAPGAHVQPAPGTQLAQAVQAAPSAPSAQESQEVPARESAQTTPPGEASGAAQALPPPEAKPPTEAAPPEQPFSPGAAPFAAQVVAPAPQAAQRSRRDPHAASKPAQPGTRSASASGGARAAAPSASAARRGQPASVAQGARGRTNVASAGSATHRPAPAGSAPAGSAPSSAPMPLVPTPASAAVAASTTIAGAAALPTQQAPAATVSSPTERTSNAASAPMQRADATQGLPADVPRSASTSAPERTRTIAKREPWQDGLRDLLQVLGVITHRAAPVEERGAGASVQSRAPARVVQPEAPAAERRTDVVASERRAQEPVRSSPASPSAPVQTQESRPPATIATPSRPAEVFPLAEPLRGGLAPAAYDDRVGDARRIVAEALPRVAMQAQADAAQVLWMASMATDPAQDRAVVEATHSPWRSEQAYLPVASSVARSRRLYDDARQAMASGRDADAVEIGWRAFAANPRDPDIAGWLAYAQLRAHPAQAETARQLALHALAFSGSRRSTRVDQWTTLAAANALTGRDVDATRSLLVALAVSSNVEYACRAALAAYSSFGDALRGPVTAMLQRIRAQGRDDEAPSCAWPSYRIARRIQ